MLRRLSSNPEVNTTGERKMASKESTPVAPGRARAVSPIIYDPCIPSEYSTLEKHAVKFFLRLKEAMAEMRAFDEVFDTLSNVEKSRFVMRYNTQRSMNAIEERFPLAGKHLSKAFTTLCKTASNPGSYRQVVDTPVSIADLSLDTIFVSLVNLKNREAAERAFEKEFEKPMLVLMLSRVKRMLADCGYISPTGAEDDQGIVEISLVEYHKNFIGFKKAFEALHFMIGLFAAVIDFPENARFSDSPPSTFCFDLYLYMGYRFHHISRDDYKRLSREQPISSHFNSKIGKAVIILNHIFRQGYKEHLNKILKYLRRDMPQHDSCNYVKRFVQDSMRAYPSAYRYMVLCSFIVEVSLALFHDRSNKDPITQFLHAACKLHTLSGMNAFENLLRKKDNFLDLQRRADRLSEAWDSISYFAIEGQFLRTVTTDQILERLGDNLLNDAMFSSRTSVADDDESAREIPEEQELKDEDAATDRQDLPLDPEKSSQEEEIDLDELRKRLVVIGSEFKAAGGPAIEVVNVNISFVPASPTGAQSKAKGGPSSKQTPVVSLSRTTILAEASSGSEQGTGGAEGRSNPDGQEARFKSPAKKNSKSKRKKSKKQKRRR